MTALALALLLASPPDLATVAEKSGWLGTGRYDEVQRLCHDFERAYGRVVRCLDFGKTPEGRPMLALAAAHGAAPTAQAARKAGRPVVLLQGGIHAGEIDGKDAGFLLLRDLLDGKVPGDPLSRVTVLFVPVFNVDGHERFGPNNRPNQVGPEEMGWRVTAQGLNLNRDYMKADSPELRAMLALLAEWDPILYVDLHVTDGAKFQPDVAVLIAPQQVGPAELTPTGRAIRAAMEKELAAEGHLALFDFYPEFEKHDDPASGFAAGVAPPRFQTGYWPLRNRFACLVETHSWKTYAVRVKATYDVSRGFVALAAREGRAWLAAAKKADAAAARLAGQDVALAWEATPKAVTLDFPGYAYTRTPSAISGVLMTRYDDKKPELWKVPFRGELAPSLTARAPGAGYVVPAAWAPLVEDRLRAHAIRFERVAHPHPLADVETFRATGVKFDAEPFEGRQRLAVNGAWAKERRDVPAGSLFVPIAQPNARLAMELLEPQAADSFEAWGFFAAAYERKEYMEPYVAEELAEQMMRDPKIRAEFDARLDSDDAFRKDPRARLDFFYERSKAWDESYRLYPVYKADVAP